MTFPARDVAAHIKRLVHRAHFRYPQLYINRHDWDDWSQEILIHVAGKWDQQRGDKWRAWVKTITRRQIINKLRDRIVAHRRMPITVMLSSVIQEDEWGDEETVYVPDIPTPEDGTANTCAALNELTSEDAKLLRYYAKAGTWKLVSEFTGLSLQTARNRGLRAAAQVKAMI